MWPTGAVREYAGGAAIRKLLLGQNPLPAFSQLGHPPPAVHGPHHVQVSVSVCVCVSQYSTNMDSHHLQSMDPIMYKWVSPFVCVCVCLPVLHHLDIHHLQSMAPVSVSVSVCVSQYSTNLDIHHLLSLDFIMYKWMCVSVCVPVLHKWVSLCVYVCPSTPPTWTSTICSPWLHYMQLSICLVCLLVPKLHQPGHPRPPVHGHIICKCLSMAPPPVHWTSWVKGDCLCPSTWLTSSTSLAEGISLM